MFVAEELDVPLERMRFELAPAEPRYYDPNLHAMATGGSRSTKSMGSTMRKAGATARAMLVAAAAQRWNVDPKTCTTANGVVSGPNGQRAPYVELLAVAAGLPVPADVALKTPDRFRIIGTRAKRLDVPPKTNGTAIYGIDVTVPGMLYASIEKPREIGGRVAAFDASGALKVPGVRKVVQVSSGRGRRRRQHLGGIPGPESASRDVRPRTERERYHRGALRARSRHGRAARRRDPQ